MLADAGLFDTFAFDAAAARALMDAEVWPATIIVLRDLGEDVDVAVAFVAGRLVEREEVRKADRRARWHPSWDSLATVATKI